MVPVPEALPPLLIAVLHRHRTNVQLLLSAQANPWEGVPIANLHRYSLQWHRHAVGNEIFTAVQAAAAQEPHDSVLDQLQRASQAMVDMDYKSQAAAPATVTVLTERAATIMHHTVWTFQNVIDRQTQ